MKRFKSYDLSLALYGRAGAILSCVLILPGIAGATKASDTIGQRLLSIPISALIFLVFNLVSMAQAVIGYWICRTRNRAFALPGYVLALQSIMTGVIAGVITHSIRTWPNKNPLTLPLQCLHDGILMGVWVPLTLITMSRLASLKSKRQTLKAEIETLVQIEESASGVLEQIRLTFESSIRNSLKVTALQAQQKLTLAFSKEGEISPLLPEIIRDIASIDMRELSHAMIASDLKPVLTKKSETKIFDRLGELRANINVALEDFALRDKLWILAVVMLGTFFENIVGSLPLELEIEIFVVHTLGVVLVLGLFKYIFTRYPRRINLLISLNIFSLIFVNEIIISYYHDRAKSSMPKGFWDHHFFVISVITILSFVARFAFLFVINQSKAKYEKLNYEMARRKAEHEIHHGEYALLAYKWAKHIHGRVQSQLLSAAERLDRSREAGDFQGFNEALLEVRGLLNAADEGFEDIRLTLQEELEHRSSLWNGLVEISGEIDSAIPTPPSQVIRLIGEVAEEAFANALRHGKASEIRYAMDLADDQSIKVAITDNGIGLSPASNEKKGLGAKLYARASQSRFTLKRNSEHQVTVLELIIPLQPSGISLA